MSQTLWTAVDDYIVDLLVKPDDALNAALSTSAAAGLPSISVSAAQGKFLHLLAKIHGAKRILEIGTLGGYSTIWLARALPSSGRLVTLELSEKHAEVARANIDRAGLSPLVEVQVGPALESLARLVAEKADPFDLVFIDADKANLAEYFGRALQLSRPGTVIVADNVVRRGAVIEQGNEDPNVQGVRRLNELISREKRVTATEIQTVGSKGYDGFALAVVNGD
jgi:predicted O-methyltransferase YrrM